METNPIHPANHSDAGSPLVVSHGPKFVVLLAWLIAVLLILVGAAFELGILGFGPYNPSDVWLFSVLSKNMWTAMTDLACPQMLNFLSAWPIVLVSLGSAILIVARRRNRFDSISSSGSQGRTRHAN